MKLNKQTIVLIALAALVVLSFSGRALYMAGDATVVEEYRGYKIYRAKNQNQEYRYYIETFPADAPYEYGTLVQARAFLDSLPVKPFDWSAFLFADSVIPGLQNWILIAAAAVAAVVILK